MRKHKQNDRIRAVVTILLFVRILFAVPGFAADEPDVSKRLILIQGTTLIAYFEGRYQDVKRDKIFFGYGWLDNHRVFVAYSETSRSEAVADLEVIDLRQLRTTKLMRIGGVGESHFDVHPSTGEVVYDDSSGIYLLRIDAKTNSYKIVDIKKDVDCHIAFWVNNKTVGCFLFKNGKMNLMKFPVPELK